MRLVPSLSIERAQGALRYRLDVPERHLHEPILEEFRQSLDDVTLQNLLQSAEALLRSPASPGFAQEAQARGQVLYRTLIPPRLREKLREISGSPLLISTSLYGMPWELLHDEQEFWGLRYALGKRLVLDRPMAGGGPTPRMRPRPRVLVIGSDPRGDLPFVRHEVDEICDTLEGAADIVCVVDRLATFETVSGYLGEGFDLIHYSGHIVSTPETGPSLLLAQERPLTASVIEANVAGRPLVFLNACASVQESQAPPVGEWEATVSSVANAFLFGGAVAAVGTVADVSDQHAARLAERFYRGVLAAKPVGEALRAARVECRDDPGIGGSPTWLSFVLYGNPGQTLLRRGAVVSLPGIPAATPEVAAQTSAPELAPAPAPLPQAAAPARRWLPWTFGVVAILAILAGLVTWLPGRLQPTPPDPLIIGVMDVRPRTPGIPPWMQELTRDGLNTVLGKFPPIKVFSRQKIDFVREKRGLGEIEAAEQLGMSKMLSAGVAVGEDRNITLDLDIVDVKTGLLEATERVTGPPDKLMELENELAVRALRALGVDPTPQEIASVLATRGNETLEAYKMFSETFGEETGRAVPAPPAGTKPTGQPPTMPAPSPHAWWSFPSSAWAGEDDADSAAIRDMLARYAAALSARDVNQVAAVHPSANRDNLATYFQNAQGLQVRIWDVDILREGNDAVVSYTRQDKFKDRSGMPQRIESRRSAELRRGPDGGWIIVALH